MEVRFATHEDVGALVELGREAHAESPRYARLEYAPSKVEDTARALLDNPYAIILIAEYRSKAIGVFAGMVVEHFFSNERYACDLILYVKQSHRGSSAAVRLLREWERALEDADVSEFGLGISSEVNPERTRRLYERLGYRAAGYIMVREVSKS